MNCRQIEDIVVFCEEYKVDHEVIEDYEGSRLAKGWTTCGIKIPAFDDSGDAESLNLFLYENLGFRRDQDGFNWVWY